MSDLGSDLRKNSVVILDDGLVQGAVNRIDFTGGSVTVSGVTATVPLGGGGGGTTITVQDEGVTQSTSVTTLNFTGAGVSASGGGAVATINVPGGGGSSVWTELDVDFGSKPVYDAQFTITDAGIAPTSQVVVAPSGKASTGRTADDWQWDGAIFAASPSSGTATCYATFIPGPIVGYRKIQYQVA